jgi:uncharacterized peroxidase-related enzyme
MSKITALTDAEVSPEVAARFAQAKAAMGKVPNLLRVMAHAPSVLNVYLDTKVALSKGVLSPKVQEQIAITVAAANGCEYCLSAHTGAARAVGVSAEDRAAAQFGTVSDAKTQAILDLAREINATHGKGVDDLIETARGADLSDAEILETAAHVSISQLTNAINNIVGTTLDFPKTEILAA